METEPATAVSDGWMIAGCPVNGPALDADGERVALAWFTAAGEAPRVQLAFSTDGGATFEEARTIDADAPAGRVDVVLEPSQVCMVVATRSLRMIALPMRPLPSRSGESVQPFDPS